MTAQKLTRQARNQRFANDGSYESVRLQLQKLAAKAYARVSGMGLSLTFDDCLQEMNLSYVQARSKWNPERGVLFSTYCQTVCVNNFNSRIEKEERERRVLGMESYNVGLPGGDDDESDDYLATKVEKLYGENLPTVESRQEARERLDAVRERLRCLSPNARRLVSALMAAEVKDPGYRPPPRLNELVAQMGLSPAELRDVKHEILAIYEVRWR